MPNHEMLQLHLGGSLRALEDGSACNAPPVYTLSAWVESTAVTIRMLRGLEVPGSLDSPSALQAWATLASRRFESSGAAFHWSAARQARAADRLINQWELDSDSLWLDEDFNSMRWSIARQLREQGVFTAEDWLRDLAGLIDADGHAAIELPEQIILTGFIEHTAIEANLFEGLGRKGVSIRREKESAAPGRSKLRQFPSPEDEWQAAALWAKSCLEAGLRSIAIVIDSGLTRSGHSARRIGQLLAAVFQPQQAASLEQSPTSHYCIQKAGTLADRVSVIDALMLLRISLMGKHSGLAFPLVSHLLRSPCWAGAEQERYARAILELNLRESGIHQISLDKVLRMAHSMEPEGALPVLIEKTNQLPPRPDGRPAARWFREVLNHWGWPGQGDNAALERDVTSLGALLETLDGMRPGSLEESLAILETLAADSSVSVGGGPLSPVQVVSHEVAIAGFFDAMWICHMDETSWPQPLTVNPYLPASARRAIPRMTPEGQLDYYRNLTRMLSASADEVIFSWSVDAGQGPRNPSALLEGLAEQEGEVRQPLHLGLAALGIDSLDDEGTNPRRVIARDDRQGLAFPEEGDMTLHGGSGFFRLQAACPLAGYLRYRLGAQFAPPPSPLASPQFRGELLHQALRELYTEASRGKGLPSENDIAPAVQAALIRLRASDRLSTAGYQAERERLGRLLREWLKLDLSRSEFGVDSLEETHESGIGRMRVKIRPDRVDRLPDGSFLVIDYKSGGSRSRALKWLLPRIQEPQLPLYALLIEDSGQKGSSAGLAFAIVRQGECAFDGISGDPSFDFQGIRVTGENGRGGLPSWEWEALKDHWREQVMSLGEEIRLGQAENQVYDAQIVEYSGLELILRHSEAEEIPAEEG